MELRITAHATNGRIQFWFNDCGTDGTDCGEGTSNPTPTLRLDLNPIALPGNAQGNEIETIWAENWSSNDAGTGPYWDQMKASIVGPIGFSGEEAQAPETNLLSHLLQHGALLMLIVGLLGILGGMMAPRFARRRIA